MAGYVLFTSSSSVPAARASIRARIPRDIIVSPREKSSCRSRCHAKKHFDSFVNHVYSFVNHVYSFVNHVYSFVNTVPSTKCRSYFPSLSRRGVSSLSADVKRPKLQRVSGGHQLLGPNRSPPPTFNSLLHKQPGSNAIRGHFTIPAPERSMGGSTQTTHHFLQSTIDARCLQAPKPPKPYGAIRVHPEARPSKRSGIGV
jgi:hypothetical protein